MGRRGGGSSGGGRSFGGGGGRSFGGRSGGGGFSRGGRFGGFSRGGGSSRGSSIGGSSRPGSSGGMFRSPRPPIIIGTNRRTGMGGGGVGSGGCGCITVPIIITLVFVMVFAIIVIAILSSGSSGSGSITRSTVIREPLPKGSVVETGYYTDELDWIQNSTKLTAGMKNFYQKTGVQPYLYITGNIDGSLDPTERQIEDFAAAKYDQLFSDEAHLLLIFFKPRPSDYSTWYLAGTQAKTVLDKEAMDILLDYVDRYYPDLSLSEEEFFSKAFNDAGKAIMKVYRSPWIAVLIVLGIGVVIIIGFIWWITVKAQKNREAEATERMLNTSLDTFGDDKAKDLAQKYQDGEEPVEDAEPIDPEVVDIESIDPNPFEPTEGPEKEDPE